MLPKELPPPVVALDNTEYSQEQYFDQQLGRMATRIKPDLLNSTQHSDHGEIIQPEANPPLDTQG